MTRAKRMQRIVALADATTREASLKLSHSRREHELNVRKLEEFRAYHREYLATLTGEGTSISASAVRELRRFIAQIEQTISALEARTARSDHRCRLDIERWQQEYRRTDALNNIMLKARSVEARAAEKREQRESDDRPPPAPDRS